MPLTAAAAGVIGSLGASAINMFSQARTNAQNKRMAEQAYSRELNATREMNVYNSPSMQVARLKAAGLSPSLAYGANGEAVGNQSDIPAFNPIPAESPKSGDLGAPFMDAARYGLEAREQLNRDNLAVAELALKDAYTYQAVMSGDLSQAQLTEIVELLGYRKDNLQSLTDKNRIDIDYTRKLMELTDEQKEEIRSRVRLNDAQISELASRSGLSNAQAYAILARFPHEIAEMDANAFFAYAQSDKAYQEITNLARDVQHIGWYENMQERHFDFEKNSMVADLEFKRYEAKVDVMNHLQDNIARVIGFGVGAATMRSGGVLPRPISGPPSRGVHGYGHVQHTNTFTPATGRYQHR